MDRLYDILLSPMETSELFRMVESTSYRCWQKLRYQLDLTDRRESPYDSDQIWSKSKDPSHLVKIFGQICALVCSKIKIVIKFLHATINEKTKTSESWECLIYSHFLAECSSMIAKSIAPHTTAQLLVPVAKPTESGIESLFSRFSKPNRHAPNNFQLRNGTKCHYKIKYYTFINYFFIEVQPRIYKLIFQLSLCIWNHEPLSIEQRSMQRSFSSNYISKIFSISLALSLDLHRFVSDILQIVHFPAQRTGHMCLCLSKMSDTLVLQSLIKLNFFQDEFISFLSQVSSLKNHQNLTQNSEHDPLSHILHLDLRARNLNFTLWLWLVPADTGLIGIGVRDYEVLVWEVRGPIAVVGDTLFDMLEVKEWVGGREVVEAEAGDGDECEAYAFGSGDDGGEAVESRQSLGFVLAPLVVFHWVVILVFFENEIEEAVIMHRLSFDADNVIVKLAFPVAMFVNYCVG